MASFTQRITLDVGGNYLPFYKYMKQGDGDSTYIVVTLTANGAQLIPSSGDTATIRVDKPDGTIVNNPATINVDGTVTARITKAMTAAAGVAKADICLIGEEDEILSTASFYLDIDNAPGTHNISSTNEFLYLQELLGGIENSVTRAANSAAEARQAQQRTESASQEAIDAKNIVLETVDGIGRDVDFDDEEQMLFMLNENGERIGEGTPIHSGISSFQLDTETDDNNTDYLILYDGEGNELARTEFTVSGSGGGSSAYTCRLINGMNSANIAIPSGQALVLNYEFYEFYGQDRTTVSGTVQYYVKYGTGEYTLVKTESVDQGSNSISCADFLATGTNYFKIQVTGGESGIVKTLTFTLNVVEVTLTSSFDGSQAYTSSISFLYRVTGRNLSKTMYFYIDGDLYDTVNIGTAHNIQLTETINLSSYGHGDHVMSCYFVTADGTRSPELTYDIIYDTGLSAPIISSTFDVEEVTYGENIALDYVVFTHGSDYTDEIVLSIYTLDNDVRINYSQSTLSDVVNQQVQRWNITEYPSEGTMYLEIVAGAASKTFEVSIQEVSGDRDLSDVTTRLIAAYSASGRSNNDSGRTTMNAVYTSKDDITTMIEGALTGFNWRSNGWLSDDDGYPILRVSGGAEVELNLPFFASRWIDSDSHIINLAGTPTAAGRTFEVCFKTHGVTDESAEIITIWDTSTNIGLKIFPSHAYLLSDSMSLTTDDDGNIINKNAIPHVAYSSTADKVRLTFVIEQVGYYVETEDGNTNKQLVRIYVNGQLAKAVSYTADSFNSSDAVPEIKAENCILDIYAMRFYDYALDDTGVLKNYIADIPSVAEKIEIYDKNDIVDENEDIDFSAAILQYPCMVLTGTLSAYKGNKVKVGVLLYKPDGSVEDGYYIEWSFMDQDTENKYGNVNNVQGTSSQYYLKKNYKITFYRLQDGVFKKVKVQIFPDRIPVSTICIKADYMSPDSANTGNANYWQSIATEKTPPQVSDERVQTSVMGYPILLFQRDTENDPITFIGRYNLNNDKGNSNAFGLENALDDGATTTCQKWEFLDNSEDICNFKTDELFAVRQDSSNNDYYAWEDALESCYPDQGDLEDDGLTPNLDMIQMAYSWIYQRANFLDASTTSGTGGTYNGTTYDTEYDLKFAIFRTEFTRHFNFYHSAHYFIANEVALLVDNFAKNMFMTSYDVTAESLVDGNGDPLAVSDLRQADGAMDLTAVDWENSTFAIWYPTLYDLDSCLGADNNGYDQFPYYAEMWDQYNNGYIVNGHNSYFWTMFYAAFRTEIGNLYHELRDEDETLSSDQYAEALIDNLTKTLPIVAINSDQRFKYIDAFEGGYYDGSANNGNGGWVYTSGFLYLVKSTMESYHRDFITKRFSMLDSKYMSDAFMNDKMTLRVNRGQSNPEDLAFNIRPCQAMYLYTEWGNSGSYIGGKCLEGNSIEMKPASSGNWSDIVIAIYGASHIKSLGDLSVLYASKLINLSMCSNLTELILGSRRSGYANTVLDSISDVSYLTMLQKLNISNCTALSGTIDLSNCDLIEEVYATGSAVSAIVLPEGGYLKNLYLPSGITSLNIVSHGDMENFYMDAYSNILRLRVENTPNIPTDAIVAARGTNLTRLRLIGVSWTLTSEAALRALASPNMAGKAIDATGAAVDDNTVYPTITGTVTISRIQKSLLQTLNTLYPNLTINYTTLYHVVTWVSEGETVKTEEVNDGGSATVPTTPSKAASVQYIYSFRGWDVAYSNITEDTTITAQFSGSTQKYDIAFYDEDETTLLASVSQVDYGADFTYPNAWPTKNGYVFYGWTDGDGNEYEYITQMPDASASIDANGLPQTIRLYPLYSEVKMPETTKNFAALTHGERLFCAIAIQNGAATGCTVTYYADNQEYIIQDTTTLATVSIAIGDYKQWTLYNGETLTQEVIGFNHDYSEATETNKLGITYAMKNLLTDTRVMNPSYKHAFNFQIGSDAAVESDNNNHSSSTDAALTTTHVATAAEVTAGFVEIDALGPTYLERIIVTHSDNTTVTWYFGPEGYYAGSDMASYSNCPFYKDDTDIDASNPFYKIGKMLQSAGIDITNQLGSAVQNWGDAQQQAAYMINQSYTFANFGGIILDATGTDTLNTAVKNPTNGTGKSRFTYFADYAYNWNCFTEMSEGAIIKVPVVSGDTVTVKCYGMSRNWGGWDNCAMKAWANETFPDQLPIGLYNTIVAAYKKSSVGNRSYAIKGGLYKLWLLSNAEINGYTTTHPYMDEGTRYSIYTNDASRIKSRADGDGAVSRWWERSPYVNHSSDFYSCHTSGGPYNNYGASGSNGVCLGFCSGEE